MIRVICMDKTSKYVNASDLEAMIAKGKIAVIHRKDGWAHVKHTAIRRNGGNYDGPERRRSAKP